MTLTTPGITLDEDNARTVNTSGMTEAAVIRLVAMELSMTSTGTVMAKSDPTGIISGGLRCLMLLWETWNEMCEHIDIGPYGAAGLHADNIDVKVDSYDGGFVTGALLGEDGQVYVDSPGGDGGYMRICLIRKGTDGQPVLLAKEGEYVITTDIGDGVFYTATPEHLAAKIMELDVMRAGALKALKKQDKEARS